MFNIIIEKTNDKIENFCAQKLAKDEGLETYHHHVDMNEMKAFVGLLYYSARWKTSNVDNASLWSTENGITFYRCVMSRARFEFLAATLRFDNRETRNRHDKFAPIRQIWDIFMNNCIRYYQPSYKCTVDEQLLSFRGRCPFRIYIKSKPDKYGIKIVMLNDAETSYMVNLYSNHDHYKKISCIHFSYKVIFF